MDLRILGEETAVTQNQKLTINVVTTILKRLRERMYNHYQQNLFTAPNEENSPLD